MIPLNYSGNKFCKNAFFYFSLVLFSAVSYSQHPAPDYANKFNTIQERFSPPPGFQRLPAPVQSFAAWIRQIPLQPENNPVLNFKGQVFKSAEDTTIAAVCAVNISNRPLEQCMDILIRLRAAYLKKAGLINLIRFPLPDGLVFSWDEWKSGYRPEFRGRNFYLRRSA